MVAKCRIAPEITCNYIHCHAHSMVFLYVFTKCSMDLLMPSKVELMMLYSASLSVVTVGGNPLFKLLLSSYSCHHKGRVFILFFYLFGLTICLSGFIQFL